MPDYGLMQGFADAISSGVRGYTEQSAANEDRALKRRLAKIQELESATKMIDTLGGLPKGVFSPETEETFYGKAKQANEKEEPDYNELADEKTGLLPGAKPQQDGLMPKPAAGLLGSQMESPSVEKIPGITTKKEKARQEKLDSYNVQLVGKGKKAVYGADGNVQFIDISSPEEKHEKETKRSKEDVDLERAQTEFKIAKMNEQKAGAGLGNELTMKALPKEKQEQIDAHGKTLAKAQTVAIQLDELHKQLIDPKMDAGQKLAIAQEQVKLLNSSLGADAVGAEEVKRIAAYLDFKPNFVKGMKVGPDLEGFANQVASAKQRQDGLITGTQGLIDKAYGRKPPEVQRPIGVPKMSVADKEKFLQALQTIPKDSPKRKQVIDLLQKNFPDFKGQ